MSRKRNQRNQSGQPSYQARSWEQQSETARGYDQGRYQCRNQGGQFRNEEMDYGQNPQERYSNAGQGYGDGDDVLDEMGESGQGRHENQFGYSGQGQRYGQSTKGGYGQSSSGQAFGGRNYGSSTSESQSEWSGQQGQVQRGEHTGKGPKGYRRSDERITEEINEKLTQHAQIDASEIEVQVSNGEVTLTGTVDGRQAKRLAEDVADEVSGVQEVNNQLRVKRSDGNEQSRSPTEKQGRSSERAKTEA